MPTTNKRVNLTFTEEVYEKLQNYKQKSASASDAAACMQLVKLQLQAQETNEQLLKLIRTIPEDQLNAISSEGFKFLKDELKKTE